MLVKKKKKYYANVKDTIQGVPKNMGIQWRILWFSKVIPTVYILFVYVLSAYRIVPVVKQENCSIQTE